MGILGLGGGTARVCPPWVLFDLWENLVCDLADHFSRQVNPIQVIQLVVDVPRAHPTRIQGDHLFFNPGYITLIFGYQFGFKFPIAVPGHIDLELPMLALEGFGGMPIAFVVCLQVTFLVFLIAEGHFQFCLHKFLQDVFEAVFEQGVDIRNTGDVVL